MTTSTQEINSATDDPRPEMADTKVNRELMELLGVIHVEEETRHISITVTFSPDDDANINIPDRCAEIREYFSPLKSEFGDAVQIEIGEEVRQVLVRFDHASGIKSTASSV
jgi:hypothetical protein